MSVKRDPKGNFTHGTATGYKDYGCRCAECTEANREYIAHKRDQMEARGKADPTLIPHGTTSGYINWRCRCDKCRAAAGRNKKVSAPVEPVSVVFDDADEFLSWLDNDA